MLLLRSERKAPEARAFALLAEAEVLLFCLSKREVPKRKRHPAWRLPPIHGRQVREPGPGFSTGLLSGRKGVDIHVDSRCAACRPRLTAAQGTPGRAAGHRGPHFLGEPRPRHARQKRLALLSSNQPQGRPAGGPIQYRLDRLGGSAFDPKRTLLIPARAAAPAALGAA